ncbi:MAG: hypothetical protein JOZ69_12215 [Myxococcales bacterium]|nr:hypothetical protein [Myxococcales bacterium]
MRSEWDHEPDAPGRRGDPVNLTLVACYGDKPAALAAFIDSAHGVLAGLGNAFTAYEAAQVHATIAGLEGYREPGSGRAFNTNFLDLRGERRAVDLGRALAIARTAAIWPLHLQLGGFRADMAYPFTSRGLHPYERSFSFSGERAVVMGWPRVGASYPPSLAELRRSLEPAGVLHKYHPTPESVDNDFFLVLGRVDRAVVPDETLRRTEHALRALARRECTAVVIGPGDLRVVAYVDPALPRESSVAHSLEQADPTALAALYPERPL